MNPESLEALLLDQALDELSPEVADLLADHLSRNPDSARRADRLASTAALARRATALPLETPRRSLGLHRLLQVRKAHRRWAAAGEILRLAACVALGLGLGWYGRDSRSAAVALESTPPSPVAALSPAPDEATGGFWSLARLEAAQRERQSYGNRTTERYRLEWDHSPKAPGAEENL